MEPPRGVRRTLRDRVANLRVRARDDRGAVLVEGAFVLPILFMVTFAIIEFGMAYGNASTTAAASRSGARFMATQFAPSGDKLQTAKDAADKVATDLGAMSQGKPLTLWIYRPTSSGAPADASCSSRCFKFTWDDSSSSWTYVSGSWTDPDACGATLDNVAVQVTIRHDFVTGFFGKTKIIKEKTLMRLEPLPSDQCPTT